MLTPGIVMCPPMRYTTSNPSVNKMRLRSSATAKRFLTLSTAIYRLLQSFRSAAGRRDLLGRLTAELVRLHRQPLADFAARQHFHALRGVRHQALFPEQLQRHHGAFVEPLAERVQVHHRVLDTERVVEAALRQPAMERHLAAFKSPLALV